MTETAEEQRTRILNDFGVDGQEYDLAVALGYEPESFDGMWKLVADRPFTERFGMVVAREVVYEPGTKKAVLAGENRVKTRLVVHPLPEGWTMVDDRRLTEAEPRVMFVSPRERAYLRNRFPWMRD